MPSSGGSSFLPALCIIFNFGVKYLNPSCSVAQSCPTLCDPIDYSPQAPLSMGSSRQEYWSGLPCLLQIFLIQGSNLGVLQAVSCIAGISFTDFPLPGKPTVIYSRTITLFCMFQVSCKCVIMLSLFKKEKKTWNFIKHCLINSDDCVSLEGKYYLSPLC